MIDNSQIAISYNGEVVELPLIVAELVLAPIGALYESSRSNDMFAIQALTTLFVNVADTEPGKDVTFIADLSHHGSGVLGKLGFVTRHNVPGEGAWVHTVKPHVALVTRALIQAIGYEVGDSVIAGMNKFCEKYTYPIADMSLAEFMLADITKQLS